MFDWEFETKDWTEEQKLVEILDEEIGMYSRENDNKEPEIVGFEHISVIEGDFEW